MTHEAVDLAELVRALLTARAAEAEARGVRVMPTLIAAPVRGDPRLLERLTANLLDNALRHNSPGVRSSFGPARRPAGAGSSSPMTVRSWIPARSSGCTSLSSGSGPNAPTPGRDSGSGCARARRRHSARRRTLDSRPSHWRSGDRGALPVRADSSGLRHPVRRGRREPTPRRRP